MTFSIRKMSSKDVEEVYNLGIIQKEFSSENGTFWTKEQLSQWCQSSNDVLIVAEQDKKIVGFSLYAVHVPTGKVTWENLYVISSARKTGVASALIKEGHKQIKALGYKYIASCVNADDQRSFALFAEKFGFKKGNKVLWIDQIITSDRDRSKNKSQEC